MALALTRLARTASRTVTAEYLCPDCQKVATRTFSAAQLHRDFTIPLQPSEMPSHACLIHERTHSDRLEAFFSDCFEMRALGIVQRVTVEL